jgi:hypothetical protein
MRKRERDRDGKGQVQLADYISFAVSAIFAYNIAPLKEVSGVGKRRDMVLAGSS